MTFTSLVDGERVRVEGELDCGCVPGTAAWELLSLYNRSPGTTYALPSVSLFNRINSDRISFALW